MAEEESPQERERLFLELILAQQKVIGVNCRFLTHTRAGKGVTLSQIAFLDESAASKSVYDKVIFPRCKVVNKAVAGFMDICVKYSTTYPKTELSGSIRSLARKLKKSVMQVLHHVLNPEKDALQQQNTIIAAYMQLTTHSSALRRLVDERMVQMDEDSGSAAKLRALTPSSLEVKVGSSKDNMEHRIKQILARVYQLAYSLENLTEQLKCFYDVRDRMEAYDNGKTMEEQREIFIVALEEDNVPFEELERDMAWEELQFVAHNRRTVDLARQKVLKSSDRAQSDLAEVVSLLRTYATQQWPHAEDQSRDELLSFWALISEMRVTASQFIHGLRMGLMSDEREAPPSNSEAKDAPAAQSEETPIPDTMKNRMSVKFHLNDWEGRMQLLKLETMQLAEQQKQVVLELEQVQQHRQLATMQLKELQREEATILNKQLQIHRAAGVKRTRLERRLKAKQELLSRMEFSISQTEQILRINNIRLLRHEQQLTQKIEQIQQQLELGHRRQLKESKDEESGLMPVSLQLSDAGSPPAKHPALSKANLSTQLEKLREKRKRSASMSDSLTSGKDDFDQTVLLGTNEPMSDGDDASLSSSFEAKCEVSLDTKVSASEKAPPLLRDVADATIVSNSSVTRHVAKSQVKLKQLEAEQMLLRDKQKIHVQQAQVHEIHREKLRVLQAQVQRLESDVSEDDNARHNHTQVLARKEQSETQEVKQKQYALLHSMRKMKFAESVLVEKINTIQARLVEHKEFLNAMLKDRVAAETVKRKQLLKKQLQQEREEAAENVSFGSVLLQCNRRFSSSFKLILESMITKLKEDANADSEAGVEEDVNIWQERQISNGEGKTVVFADGSDQVVKAGTLNQLVIQLTDEKRHDLNFVKTFITTFSSFTTPETLFKKLVQRYEVPKAQSGDISEAQWKQNVVLPIQLRVFNVLKIWLDTRFPDFDYKLLKMLNDFIDNHCRRDGHSKMAKNLSSLVKRKIAQAKDEDKEIVPTVVSTVVDMSATVRMTKVDQVNSLSEEFLAKCLTAIEFANFRKIEPQELLNQAWVKTKYRYRARNVLKMIENFNMVSGWVALSICCPEKLRSRTAALVRFIKVAQFLYEGLHNFSTLMAVLAGISSSAVHRLKFTYEDVPKKWKEVLESLQALMSSTKSYKNYRTALQRASPPSVPYTGIWLTDLVFIDDGNPNTISGLINFRKREMTYKIIEDIQQYGQTPYSFGELDRNALDLVAHLPGMSEEDLWELSQKREPRGKDRSELVQ